LARRQSESVLAGGKGDGGVQLQPNDYGARRSSIGWEAAGGGNGGADWFRWRRILSLFIFRVLHIRSLSLTFSPFNTIFFHSNRPVKISLLTYSASFKILNVVCRFFPPAMLSLLLSTVPLK
jgi:hypothetical protein